MDDWDWGGSDWGSSYDWSTPSWDVPSYDWSAPSYDWSLPSFSYDDYSSPWDSVTISDWSTPSYDSGYWSDYLPSYDSSYDWSTPSYDWSTPSYGEWSYSPTDYEVPESFTWSDIQSPDYSYADYSDVNSSLRNIDMAEGLGQLNPYQAEEARLGVQQTSARDEALARLQDQAGEELSSLTSDAYRQQQIDDMMAQAGQEQAAIQAELARQDRTSQMQQQASSELEAVRAQLARDAVKSAMGTLSDTLNPKAATPAASTDKSLLAQLAQTLGATGLKQAQAAANYQASPVAGVANTAQSVLQILKALKGQNLMPTQARASTVQNIGPTAQSARPTRTLYAKGGKVELPSEVMGGLLPLTLKIAEHMMGMSQGSHQGLIPGEAGGQDDVVDIKAAPGEYIMDAEIVSAIGDGNNEEGARKLDKMRYNIRKHKREGGLAQIAPKAKNLSAYLKGK